MKKILKIALMCLILPIAIMCVGCDETPPGGDEPPADTGKDYTINFVEEYQYEGPNGTDYAQHTMHSVQIDVGDTVTFPTTEWLFENNKVQHHDNAYIINSWYYYTSNYMIVYVDEDYFTTEYTGGHMTLIAEWGSAPQPINYDLDGGVNHPDNPTTASSVDFQEPTKVGYKFVGWTYGSDSWEYTTEPQMYVSIYEVPSDNFTIKAHWERNEVVLLGNSENSGEMEPIYYDDNGNVNLPSNEYAKNHCTFIGWCTDRYGDGDMYTDTISVDGGKVTLYAIWDSGLEFEREDYYRPNNDHSLREETAYNVIGVKDGVTDVYIPKEWCGHKVVGVRIYNDNDIETVTLEEEGVNIDLASTSSLGFDITDCENVHSIEIPAHCKSIGETYTTNDHCVDISGCPNLTSLNIPENLTKIYIHNTLKVEELVLPETVIECSIGSIYLKKLYIPSGCEFISLDTPALEEVTMPCTADLYGTSLVFKDVFYIDEDDGVTIGNAVLPANLRKVSLYRGVGTKSLNSAFSGISSIREINVLEELESGVSMFAGLENLEKITFAEGVITIPHYMLQNCTNLTEVKISSTVRSIYNEVFNGCTSLSDITIANGLTSIGYGAFKGCTSLTEISLPDTLTTMSESIFEGCTNLSTVNASYQNVATIPSKYLLNTAVTTFEVKGAIKNIGDSAFENTSITAITNSGALESVGKCAFMNTKISSIDLSSYTSDTISQQMFEGCVNLTQITIPNTIESIEYQAFMGCTGITSLDIFTNVVSIGQNAFRGTGITEFIAWEKLESLDSGALAECTSLTTIDLSHAAENFSFTGGYVFYNCTNLAGMVTIPNSVDTIYGETFTGTKITEIDIEDGGTPKISGYAFRNMSALKKANLTGATGMNQGNDISGFQFDTFYNTPALEELILSVDYTMNSYASDSLARMIGVYEDDYNADPTKWSVQQATYNTSYYLPKSLKTLRIVGVEESHPYYALWTVTDLIFDDTLKELSGNALSGMSSMVNLTMPNCEIVGAYALNSAINLNNMVAPKIKTVGNSAFANTPTLGTFSSRVVESVGDFAFSESGISYIDLSNVTSIGYGAFKDCVNLTSVESIDKCTSISEQAFAGSGITSITPYCALPREAFMGATALKSVDLSHMPSGSEILNGVFDGAGLETILITSNIATIKSGAFENSALKYMYFENDATTTIERGVFDYTTNTTLKAVHFGPNVTIESGVLEHMAGIESVSVYLDSVENNLWYMILGESAENEDISLYASTKLASRYLPKSLQNITIYTNGHNFGFFAYEDYDIAQVTIHTTGEEDRVTVSFEGGINKVIIDSEEIVTTGAMGTLYITPTEKYYEIDNQEEYESVDGTSAYLGLYAYVDNIQVHKINIDNSGWVSEYMSDTDYFTVVKGEGFYIYTKVQPTA